MRRPAADVPEPPLRRPGLAAAVPDEHSAAVDHKARHMAKPWEDVMRWTCSKALGLGMLTLGVAVATAALPANAQTPVRVGWCTKAVTSATSPWAIAMKLGWIEKAGLALTVIPTAGSADCMKLVATRDYLLALSGIEALATMREQGVKVKIIYTAYRNYVFGIRVPADSPVKTVADLKGKTVGVNSMGSNGVLVTRAMTANAGLDPQKDINIVVIGEGAQAAAQIKNKQVDAYSAFDTAYALVENAGVPLRDLPNPNVTKFPSAGMYALEESIANQRTELVSLGQAFAKGQIFAMANPEAAVRILWEMFPQTKPTGTGEATALNNEIKVLTARAQAWSLDADKLGIKRWGESVGANYQAYYDWLLEQKVIKQKLNAKDIVTNELIDDINKFDAAEVVAMARAYKAK
jgi:NitT/TauT family transport system substrate-binding protein